MVCLCVWFGYGEEKAKSSRDRSNLTDSERMFIYSSSKDHRRCQQECPPDESTGTSPKVSDDRDVKQSWALNSPSFSRLDRAGSRS
jgi:hypothetical protein